MKIKGFIMVCIEIAAGIVSVGFIGGVPIGNGVAASEVVPVLRNFLEVHVC
jgi:6,7-dimethyl-8-ribityllumazine synthase